MITRDQAWDKLNSLIKNQNLINHCLAVEIAMNAYADKFKVSEKEKQEWGKSGLIHDADYEQFPNKHPQIIAQWVRENNGSEEMINAILSHGFELETKPKTLMAKTLRAVDELTGLIVAVALVKDKKLENVSVKSVVKKWKDKTFAKGVKREDIDRGAAEIGVVREDHIKTVLTAMQKHSSKLGL